MALTSIDRIEVTAGICDGRPRIAGTRIRVQDVVAWYEFQGMSPDEIVSGYPHISLADVHAALAYYHSHRDDIQDQMRLDEAFVESLRGSRSGLTGTDAHDHPVSP